MENNNEWLPIESAPKKDGTRILVLVNNVPAMAEWDSDFELFWWESRYGTSYRDVKNNPPTHWKPV